MARKQVEDCMFCGQPHAGLCGGTQPKKATPRVSTRKLGSESAPPGEVEPSAKPADVAPQGRLDLSKVERVRPAIKPAPPVPSVPAPSQVRPDLSGVPRVRDADDEQLSYAITLFAERDMLHHETLTEHRDKIKMPESKIDAMIWRQVNRDEVERGRDVKR